MLLALVITVFTVSAQTYTFTVTPNSHAPVAPAGTDGATTYTIVFGSGAEGCTLSYNTSINATDVTLTTASEGSISGAVGIVWPNNSSSGQGTINFKLSGCTTSSMNQTVTRTYDILSIPGSISGSSSVSCGSQSVTYSVSSVPNASSYSWEYPSGWSVSGCSTCNSITFNTDASSSGNVKVKANGGNTQTSSPNFSVTRSGSVPPTPSFTSYGSSAESSNGSRVLCSSTDFSVTSSGATSYTWSSSGGVSVSGSSGTGSISASGDGTITVSANNSCGSSAGNNVTIVASAPSSPSFTADGNSSSFVSMCSGSSLYLVTNEGKATSYNFTQSSGSGLIYYSGNSASFTSYTPNTYQITASAINCFGQSNTTKYIQVINCGYRMGANPTSDVISISFDTETPLELLPDNIQLFDNNNNIVYNINVKSEIKSKSIRTINLDVSKVKKGEYILNIYNENHPDKDKKVESHKFIVI